MGRQLKNHSDEEKETNRKRKLEQSQAVVDENPELVSSKKDKKKKNKKDKKKNIETEIEDTQMELDQEEDTQLKKTKKGDEFSNGNDSKKKNKCRNDENGDTQLELEQKEDTQLSDVKRKKKKAKKGGEFSNGEAKRGNVVEEEGLRSDAKKKDGDFGDGEEGKKGNGVVEEKSVVVSGKDSSDSKYAPLGLFSDSGLPDEVLDCCKSFAKPSPIQSHAWPFLLDGRDFIGIAQTGSGKTLAFGVPAMMHVLGKRKGDKSKRRNPLCLVLSPTRELAQQIANVLCSAGQSCGVKSSCFYGGNNNIREQIAVLKSGVDIVIGCPGRLKDLIEKGACCLQEASFVVLDEADRMLDMGFEQDVRAILSRTSSARQMVMFSATWPMAVHRLAQEFMDPNPVKVVVGSEDLAANHDVMQIVEVLEDRERDRRLFSLLEKYHQSKRNRVIVFVLYKKEADRVERMLQGRGWDAVAIHADKHQSARDRSLSLFKSGKCPLLIATDVAARGLDIPDVEVVINYSFPLTTEDYVHRIGRTGRAGKKGVAHTFFTKENKGLAGELVNVLREAGQHIPPDLLKFGTHVKKKESKLYGAHFREITADAPKATKITFGDSDDE